MPPMGSRFGVALGLTAAAFAARWALDPFLFDRSPFHVFALAVLLTAIFGGPGPGMVAAVLSAALANVFFLVPRGVPSLAAPDLLETSFFVVTSGTIVWVTTLFRRARHDALEAHDELITREALVRSILDTVPDAMIVIDEHGVMQSFSSAAERLFGYHAAEAVGRNVSVLMPAPYREQHDGYIARYLRTGERRIIGMGRVVVGQRKNGTVFPIELSVGEVRAAGRRLFTGFIRDLTERQERETRFQEIQNELIHISRVSEMGQMASTISHEINQPLAAVSNYINASLRLLDSNRPEALAKAKETAQKAADQTLRAADIVRRLRLFMRKGETDRRVELIRHLIEEASALALIGSKSRGVDVRFEFPDDPHPVLVDRVQIQQVLVNLIRNAVDAMSEHPVRSLTLSFRPQADGMIEVSVIDTGLGLPADAKERLFQPFFTTKAEGMGIGLSICRSIVRGHGGELWAEVNPAGGAIFRFTLPMAETIEAP